MSLHSKFLYLKLLTDGIELSIVFLMKSSNPCFSAEVFTPFTFNLVIHVVGLKFAILLFVSVYPLCSFSFVALLFWIIF